MQKHQQNMLDHSRMIFEAKSHFHFITYAKFLCSKYYTIPCPVQCPANISSCQGYTAIWWPWDRSDLGL